MAEILRFGIVGCGVITGVHADALGSLPDAQLVAVADTIPDRVNKIANKYKVKPYTSLQAMLEQEQLDVVTVCTPSGYHGEHACQVMRAGRHVIVEKPMEIRREAIDEMLRVQQEQRVKMAVISQHRFDKASMHVHQLVQEQAFGRLVLGNVLVPWWRSQKYYDGDAWRGTLHIDGGGVLINQAIHSIDLLQWFMGPVKSIYAYTDTLAHSMEGEDIAVAVLRFVNGAFGSIVATTGAYPGASTRIGIFGDRGSAIIEDDQPGFLHLARDESEEAGPYGVNARIRRSSDRADKASTAAQDPAALSYKSHALQIADMIRAIKEDGTPLVDGHAGRQPVEIILRIYESARTQKESVLS